MKVTLISYDFWNYDRHIVTALQKRGVDAHHIKLSDYRHPGIAARAENVLSKIFLGKNLKIRRRQEMILEKLEEIGQQDQILVINPESISPEFHQKIKKFTKVYKAYLYDAVARNPVEKILPFFNEIFSFDRDDCLKYGFREVTNYIYLPERTQTNDAKLDLIYIGSYDGRILKLNDLSKVLNRWQKKFKFIIIGKRTWKKKFRPNTKFTFRTKKIDHKDLPDFYKNSRAIMDLVRDGQSGLSFRLFEAMALKKKVVTDNSSVKNYDFYKSENILVLGEDELRKEFFETPYQEIPKEIYKKYTVEHWVEKVFDLNKK